MTPQIKLSKNKALITIAAIPSIDCICDQLNNALRLHLGPLSILQALRSALIVLFAFIIVRRIRRSPSQIKIFPLPALAAALVLSIAASKELIVTGTLSAESIGAYGQMLYWVMLWATTSLLCSEPRGPEVILRGLALGSLLTAISVFVGLLVGAGNYYTMDSVLSSAGWFDTGKMITGILVVGGIVTLYLGRSSQNWIAPIVTALCASACILTYARAGQAALLVSTIWLAFWRFFLGRNNEGRSLNRWFALLLIGCVLLPFAVNLKSIFARWGDVGSSDSAGSGRATFWRVAVHAYESEDSSQQILGIGYKSMSEMLFRDYGEDIKHTHNDFLDLLLVGGWAGVILFLTFVTSFGYMALRSGPHTAEGAAAIAIFIAYLCHSQLTGQIWGTDSMTYYTLGLTCLSSIARRNHAIHFPVTFNCQQALAPL